MLLTSLSPFGEDPKHVLIQKDDEDAFQISRIQLTNQYTVQKEVVVKVTFFIFRFRPVCAIVFLWRRLD